MNKDKLFSIYQHAKHVSVLGIDQSLAGTGLAFIGRDGTPNVALIAAKKLRGTERTCFIVDAVVESVSKHKPDLICMEMIARLAGSSSVIPLAMLAGSIRYGLAKAGRPDVITVNQSSMKKYVLGEGGTKKDSSYLLKVFEKTGVRFEDDNVADAWMHAKLVQEIVGLAGDVTPFFTYTTKKKESVYGILKKHIKMTFPRFNKLCENEVAQLLPAAVLTWVAEGGSAD